MRFAYFSHVWNKPGYTAAQRYRELWDELRSADRLGFDYAFSVEHHFVPNESWMPSPPLFCAGAGVATERIRVGPMGYVAPLYNPIRIAEEVLALDAALDGRLDVGFASGVAEGFFGPYRADYPRRRELTLDAVRLIKEAYAGGGEIAAGPDRSESLNLAVSPTQRPHPPIWVPSRDRHMLRTLAAEGAHTASVFIVPREALQIVYRQYLQSWEAAGHAAAPHIGYWTTVYVAPTDRQAVEEAGPHVRHAFTQVLGYGEGGNRTRAEGVNAYQKRAESGTAEIIARSGDLAYLLERNLVLVGSPRTVARNIRRAADEGLFDTLFAEFNLGAMPAEQVAASVDLFAREVMPALREYQPY